MDSRMFSSLIRPRPERERNTPLNLSVSASNMGGWKAMICGNQAAKSAIAENAGHRFAEKRRPFSNFR